MTCPSEEHIALVALLRSLPKGTSWSDATERVLEHGSAQAAWASRDEGALLPDPATPDMLSSARSDLHSWADHGWRFLSILDPDYPSRLREIYQAPPFLFARGRVMPDDLAVSVVGSRKASERARDIARLIAGDLVEAGITVLSGLAEGIDTAAHEAALDADGRTVAILGTGISRAYPESNRELQDTIAEAGLVLSQFWPDAPPQRHSFPMRNAVMSGYGRATVVVEAGEHSGARTQARKAVEHGRPVILTDDVVASTEWAKKLQGRPGVHVATNRAEFMRHTHQVVEQERDAERLFNELVGSGW
ncbi:DNA-processing protein DprA [Haloechinothrix alba]|nr:DNA-processing protein DprA [Haloechinothrix alba]